MKVLVIGGTRFFGASIAQRLVDKGHSVTLLNRGQTPDDFGESVERIRGDRNDYRGFVRQFENKSYDAVIDMIAFRAEDTQAAVKAFAGKTDHYIHISTGAVYLVTQDYPTPIKEEDFDRPLYAKPEEGNEWWDYGFHKRECENVLQKAFKESEFPSTVFRLPIVIGEKEYTLRAYSYFIRITDGKPMIVPDGGLNVFTLVYQNDIARTVVDNLLNPASYGQAYNLAQDDIMTTKSFISMAAGILGKKPELVDIPSGLLNRTPLKTSFSPYFSRRAFVMDVAKAKRDLQYRATPPKEWMTKTIRWFDRKYSGPPPDNYALREMEISFAGKYKAAVKSLLNEL
jgi:nucleoside-diphosphate-sugar epimerase